uniref:60S ribosomal export protein NMD3 n=1 Tax=Taiwania cryptomerioides TaxID=50187 RepID=B3ST70_TAICR|nr:nonsense-mediated mRNA decary protein 3 [Taiwania cryptomerioides]
MDAEGIVADMFTVQKTMGQVLCCMCGISMPPNAANMCVNCIRSQVDITEGLQKHVTILHCPECSSYLQPPKTWIKAQLESKELLTFCIKRLKNLNKVRLVHAEFIWTEPHSKRIKIKLRIQKEVLNGAILEQAYVVEYVQQENMCDNCRRVQTNPDQYVAVVQVRQHVSHRRTFFYLEQLILKHGAASQAVNIKQVHEGVDFYFANRSHGSKFVNFLGSVVPTLNRNDKQLVSQDIKNSTYNYKYTFSVQICPICKEDLICLPPKVSSSLGNLGPLVLCTKVSTNIMLLDPFTSRHAFMDANQYWRVPFRPLLSGRQLVEYIVLDIEVNVGLITVGGMKYSLADAQVARVSDFGKNDTIFNVKTHLGHLLNPGDYALGFDLYGANTNDLEMDKYKGLNLPDVVLVKKSYEEKRQKKRGKPRPWKLNNLPMEVEPSSKGRTEDAKEVQDYEKFLEELEEDQEMRSKIALYRNKNYQPSETASMTDGEDGPAVPLEELLNDLTLEDDNEQEDEEMEG